MPRIESRADIEHIALARLGLCDYSVLDPCGSMWRAVIYLAVTSPGYCGTHISPESGSQ